MTDDILNKIETGKIHFIGIGGISMSGLAEILLSQGCKISGSDIKASSITSKLQKKGMDIHIGHSPKNVQDPDLVVYTAAVKENNPELMEALRKGIHTIDRAVLLGQMMKSYNKSIAVSGTHGKTTTTSMISSIMLEAGKNPTIHIGGELDLINGSARIGSNEYFITEACEYHDSFLKFFPFAAVILNIEFDHADFFKDIFHIKDTFRKFVDLVPKEGFAIVNGDDPNVVSIMDGTICNTITFGVKNSNCDWFAKNISWDECGYAVYDLYKSSKKLGKIRLSIPGIHNIYNSLAAISACSTMGCDLSPIKKGLLKFRGTNRRLETKGVYNNIKVMDDYAHHPTEVKATLKAAAAAGHSKIWCVFQPHTYTRTKAFIDQFAKSFEHADRVIVTDIYAAREKDNGEIHAKDLVDRINNLKADKALYMNKFSNIADYLTLQASPGDLVITMGAGDIHKVGEMLLGINTKATG